MALSFNLFAPCFILLMFACNVNAKNSEGIFNVKDYGAHADAKTDDTKAFQEAWNEACSMEGKPKLLIPKGTYLVGPLMFKGPCKGFMEVQLKGKLLALEDLDAYEQNWIEFRYINGIKIHGGGKIDGQGASAWPKNNCHKDSNCKTLPSSLVLSFVSNATISKISSYNSRLVHLIVFASENLDMKSLTISAPDESPNTDGIRISTSTNITVFDTKIGTGDDCIAILSGCTNITVSGVFCGPGHGISVGSLGKDLKAKDVNNFTVRNSTFTNTTNGLRIKTWQSSPITTTASNFLFENIVTKDVANPIIIDQKYCPHGKCDTKSPSGVKINNVKFKNIRGTSTTPVAINLLCSDAVPCSGVELIDIDLKYEGDDEDALATSSCVNVEGFANGNVNPPSCI